MPENSIFAAMTATTTPSAQTSSPTPVPVKSEANVVAKTETPTKSKWLGGSAFRPNGVVSSAMYRNIIIAEIVGAVALWLLMPSIIPSPMRIWNALVMLLNEQGLVTELLTSLTLNAQALLTATVISLTISYAAAIPIFRPLATVISKLRFLSTAGISFVAVLIVGGGHPLKLSLLVLSMSTFFITSMVDVVLQVPQDNLDYVRTLRAGEWRVLWEARVLGTIGNAFDVLRQNAAMGWMMLTMVEGMIRGEGGIGRLLDDQEKHFSLAAIFAIQFVFVSVGILQDMLIVWAKDTFAPFANLSYKERK